MKKKMFSLALLVGLVFAVVPYASATTTSAQVSASASADKKAETGIFSTVTGFANGVWDWTGGWAWSLASAHPKVAAAVAVITAYTACSNCECAQGIRAKINALLGRDNDDDVRCAAACHTGA